MTEEHLIKIKYLIPQGKTEITVSESLSKSFETSRVHGLEVDWIEESVLLEIFKLQQIRNLPEIVVIDPNSTSDSLIFNYLTQYSREGILTVIGPQCLTFCLNKNCSIPDTRYPVISAAMRGCVVTSSGIRDPDTKHQLQMIVERLWGEWSDSLHDGVTHLVTNTVLSDKYRTALSADIPVMTMAWLHEVWRLTLSDTDMIPAIDKRFGQFKCPPLLGVRVCVTQLERQDRDLIRNNVESCGGEYSGTLDTNTSILVCVTNTGAKYQAARQWGTPCVSPKWVTESVMKGECLDPANYRVDGNISSHEKLNDTAPLPQDHNVSVADIRNTRLENIKNISRSRTSRNSSNDSFGNLNNSSMTNNVSMSMNNSTLPINNTSMIEDLDLREVKKAGTFLDGCKVFLGGFTKEDEAHVARCLKYAGAVRLLHLVESVTHVVIGDPHSPDAVNIQRQLCELDLVTINVDIGWIVASMRAHRPLSESEYASHAGPAHNEETVDVSVEPVSMMEESSSFVDKLQFEKDLLAQYK